ncbi:MAG: PAS domain S-box protein [Promethearchaeota archaeon]|nr:MAG: PAS domain S-box protein [Candidatus Lokiarchaeota archaeon]
MIGSISKEMLEGILETIPVDISILDANDKVIGWNHHETRIFKRPEVVLGKDVRECHPEKSLDKVEKIIDEMKEGVRNKAQFWIDHQLGYEEQPRKVLIEYYALRDPQGNYVGVVEASQDVTGIQNLKGEKRLLD